MAEDDRSDTRPAGPAGNESATPLSAPLPDHASSYFSPRTPPASTSHDTLETEAVRLDPAIDPDLAETHRLSVEKLVPPPWMNASPNERRPTSDSPTVLIPVVRARHRRRKVVVGLVAALVGAAAGVALGLAPSREGPPVPAVAARAPERPPPNPSPPPPLEHVPASTPSSPELEVAALQPVPGAGTETARNPGLDSPDAPPMAAASHRKPRRSVAPVASSAPTPWLKAEPPKAWFK